MQPNTSSSWSWFKLPLSRGRKPQMVRSNANANAPHRLPHLREAVPVAAQFAVVLGRALIRDGGCGFAGDAKASAACPLWVRSRNQQSFVERPLLTHKRHGV